MPPTRQAHRGRKSSQPQERQHPLVIQLRRYAAVFRQFETPLLETAQRINRMANLGDAKMRAEIIEAIDQGCHTIGELVDETGFDEQIVRRIYAELIDDGQYDERPIGHKPDSGKGRRMRGIFHKSTAPGNAYSSHRSTSYYENPDGDDDD